MLCDSVNFTSSVAVGFSFPLFSGAGWWILCLHEARDGRLWWGYFELHDDNVRTSYAAKLLFFFESQLNYYLTFVLSLIMSV